MFALLITIFIASGQNISASPVNAGTYASQKSCEEAAAVYKSSVSDIVTVAAIQNKEVAIRYVCLKQGS